MRELCVLAFFRQRTAAEWRSVDEAREGPLPGSQSITRFPAAPQVGLAGGNLGEQSATNVSRGPP